MLALSDTSTRPDNSEGHEQGCLLVGQPCAPLPVHWPVQDDLCCRPAMRSLNWLKDEMAERVNKWRCLLLQASHVFPYLSARSGEHLLAPSATTTRSDNSEGHEQGCLLVDQPCAPLTNDEPTQDSPLKKRKTYTVCIFGKTLLLFLLDKFQSLSWINTNWLITTISVHGSVI